MSAAYCILMSDEEDLSQETKEKINALVGCLLRAPDVMFDLKVQLFNFHAKKALQENELEEHSELVSDIFDAIYYRNWCKLLATGFHSAI